MTPSQIKLLTHIQSYLQAQGGTQAGTFADSLSCEFPEIDIPSPPLKTENCQTDKLPKESSEARFFGKNPILTNQ